MSANDNREDLKAFIDGELTPERAAEVERAISENSELRQEVEDMKRITQSLKAMAHGPAITGEEKAIGALRPRRSLIPVGLASAATLAICAAILYPVFTQSKHSARLTSLEAADESMPAPAEPGSPNLSSPDFSGTNGMTGKAKGEYQSSGGGGALVPHRWQNTQPRDRTGSEISQLPGNAIMEDGEVGIRSVVRTASLTVKVDSAEIAERQVVTLVKGWRGFVESSESGNLAAQNARITMAVRVPEKFFDEALQAFEKLGARTAKVISGQDVTSQLVDMGARLKNLRAQEETYRQILRQTRRVGEVLEVQQRISDIRSEIESMDAQMQSLRKLAALASVSVTFEQRPSGPQANANDGGWANDVWASASAALGSALKSVATAGIWFFVYAPIWLPIAFIGWALTRRLAVSGQR